MGSGTRAMNMKKHRQELGHTKMPTKNMSRIEMEVGITEVKGRRGTRRIKGGMQE